MFQAGQPAENVFIQVSRFRQNLRPFCQTNISPYFLRIDAFRAAGYVQKTETRCEDNRPAGMDNWSGREDLNLRPPRPERGALPGCATPRSLQNPKRKDEMARTATHGHGQRLGMSNIP